MVPLPHNVAESTYTAIGKIVKPVRENVAIYGTFNYSNNDDDNNNNVIIIIT